MPCMCWPEDGLDSTIPLQAEAGSEVDLVTLNIVGELKQRTFDIRSLQGYMAGSRRTRSGLLCEIEYETA